MVQPLPCSLGIGLLIAAAPAAALAEAYVPFPSQDNLRQVQLAALACARENSPASCDQARRLADPLLDHPRLPTGCKDHLWAISQKAQPAASNSFARREAISQPAQLLLLACRSGEKAPEPAAAPPAGSGGGGLKFGGGR
ncbi:MAG: hypothetical protein ACKO5M_08580 [Vulcanococcus sp.]